MTTIVIKIIIVVLLLFLTGGFAMTEMAVASSRETRLCVLAADGNAGTKAGLAVAESPNRFLPTVQIGITLVGLLAGASGGITIAEEIADALKPLPALAAYAEAIGVGVVVVTLTSLSLIIGELVPKRLALAQLEVIASRLAQPVELLSRLTRPIVWLLGASTDLVLRLLGARATAAAISLEEVHLLLKEGTKTGVFHQSEPRLVESLLAFDQRPVRDALTPSRANGSSLQIVRADLRDEHQSTRHHPSSESHTPWPPNQPLQSVTPSAASRSADAG